jgi:glutathione S-transferase
MKLYVDRHGTAPSPRRVRVYLAEKGIEVPYERLEIHQENRTSEFARKNPLQTLPVLELDDGTCIAESLAICRYFEELHPDPPLLGASPKEKAEVEMWTRRVELYLYLPIEFANPKVTGEEGSAVFRSWREQSIVFLDRLLAEREFIAGDRYTIADVCALCALDFGMAYVGVELSPKREQLIRWHRSVSARPSARA